MRSGLQRTAEAYLLTLETAHLRTVQQWAGGRANQSMATRSPRQAAWEEAYGWLAGAATQLSDDQHERMDRWIEQVDDQTLTLHWAYMTRPRSFLRHIRRVAIRNPAAVWTAIVGASPASQAALGANDLVPYLVSRDERVRLKAIELLAVCTPDTD